MVQPTTLDPATGALHLPDLVVTWATCPADVGVTEVQDGWSHLQRRNVPIPGGYLGLTLFFEGQQLQRMMLFYSEAPLGEPTWTAWSAEEEARTLARQERWLDSQLGAERSFSWGAATALFDQRGAATFILISRGTPTGSAPSTP